MVNRRFQSLAVFAVLLLLNTQSKAQLYFPPTDSDNWETISPSELNWCNDSLESLYGYLESVGTKAFMVLKDGKIVTEQYFNKFGPDSLWYWASAGKSLRSVLLGIAMREGVLSMEDKTSDHIDTGWTSCCPEKEELIKVKHQMSMTSGLDDRVRDPFCSDDTCLKFLVNPEIRWAYHNAPYSLLKEVLENSTGESSNRYTRTRVNQITGMSGLWIKSGYNTFFWSNARSMARFGLLALNRGDWGIKPVLADTNYFNLTTNSSQNINPSYGYLWWLNGKASFMVPGSQFKISGPLIPNAPSDMYAAMGANEQRIYVVPSENLVIIRMGQATGQMKLAISSFDNILWGKINGLKCVFSNRNRELESLNIFPNPASNEVQIVISNTISQDIYGEIYSHNGRLIKMFEGDKITIEDLSPGLYQVSVVVNGKLFRKKLIIH